MRNSKGVPFTPAVLNISCKASLRSSTWTKSEQKFIESVQVGVENRRAILIKNPNPSRACTFISIPSYSWAVPSVIVQFLVEGIVRKLHCRTTLPPTLNFDVTESCRTSKPQMNAASLDKDCFPEPPTPMSIAFPLGRWMMRHIRVTCSCGGRFPEECTTTIGMHTYICRRLVDFSGGYLSIHHVCLPSAETEKNTIGGA